MTAATSPSPSKDPNAPALNPGVLGLTAGSSIIGVVTAIASFLGAAPAGTSPDIAGIGGIVLAAAGILGTLLHSTDVGKRFQHYLLTAHGVEAQLAPHLAPIFAQVQDMASGNTHAAAIIASLQADVAGLKTKAADVGVTPDMLRQAAAAIEGQPAADAPTGAVPDGTPPVTSNVSQSMPPGTPIA